MNFLQHYWTIWSRCSPSSAAGLLLLPSFARSELHYDRWERDTTLENQPRFIGEIFRWERGNKFSMNLSLFISHSSFASALACGCEDLHTVCASLAFPSSMLFLSVIFFRSLWIRLLLLISTFFTPFPLCCLLVLFAVCSSFLATSSVYVWWIFNLIYIQLELRSGPNPSQWQPVNSICKYMPSSAVYVYKRSSLMNFFKTISSINQEPLSAVCLYSSPTRLVISTSLSDWINFTLEKVFLSLRP